MARADQQNELVQLQSELAAEIGRDAPHIARMVFGDNADHPDMARVPNQQLDDLYRQKFQANDRTWLQAEARRDPEQFLKVAERIGVQQPPPGAPPPPAPDAFAQAALSQTSGTAPTPAVSAALPAPAPALAPPPIQPAPVLAPAAPTVAAPPPVLLGPNGQPLPPSIGQ